MRLGGDDVVEASGLAAGAIQLTADGGEGNDILIGSAGNDTQGFFLRLRQLGSEHQVEELNGVGEGHEAAVVQVGRGIHAAAQREGLDRAVRQRNEIIHGLPDAVEAARPPFVFRTTRSAAGAL